MADGYTSRGDTLKGSQYHLGMYNVNLIIKENQKKQNMINVPLLKKKILLLKRNNDQKKSYANVPDWRRLKSYNT